MIIEISTGIYYDNFADATLGHNLPDGWELVGASASAPVVVADPTANGGKKLSFLAGSAPMGFIMLPELIGEPDNFEVLMKLKVEEECSGFNPPHLYGGPGGRISDDGWVKGIGVAASAQQAYMWCGWMCQLGKTHPAYLPPVPIRPGSYIYIKGRGDFNNQPGTATPDPNSSYAPVALVRGGGFGGGTPAEISFSGEYVGGPATRWQYIRLRVDTVDPAGETIQRIRAKRWLAENSEPATWQYDGGAPGYFYPTVPGGVGAIIFGEGLCSEGATEIDYIVIALDPETNGSPEVQTPMITSNCPLPDGIVGTAYTFELETNI